MLHALKVTVYSHTLYSLQSKECGINGNFQSVAAYEDLRSGEN